MVARKKVSLPPWPGKGRGWGGGTGADVGNHLPQTALSALRGEGSLNGPLGTRELAVVRCCGCRSFMRSCSMICDRDSESRQDSIDDRTDSDQGPANGRKRAGALAV